MRGRPTRRLCFEMGANPSDTAPKRQKTPSAGLAAAHRDLYRLMAAYFDIDTALQPPEFSNAIPS